MRLSKVSELIHNSTNHRDLNSASVSVHFARITERVGLVSSLMAQMGALFMPQLLHAVGSVLHMPINGRSPPARTLQLIMMGRFAEELV
jgi:hypothetical protein